MFRDSNLSLLRVSETRFVDIEFDACKMVGVDWGKARWPTYQTNSPFKFYNGCNLSDSSFFGLNLGEIEIINCKLHAVDFRECSTQNAVLTGNDFLSALFDKTDLKGTDFTDSFNYNINIFENEVQGARFSRIDALGLLTSLDISLID